MKDHEREAFDVFPFIATAKNSQLLQNVANKCRYFILKFVSLIFGLLF